MYCSNCGLPLKDDELTCPNCQATENNVVEGKIVNNANETTNNYENYKETEQLFEKYGFNKLLVLTIIELICCSKIFGIIALVLLLVQLKPSIEHKKFEDADKTCNNVKLILIIGLVISIIVNIIGIVLNLLPLIFTLPLLQ